MPVGIPDPGEHEIGADGRRPHVAGAQLELPAPGRRRVGREGHRLRADDRVRADDLVDRGAGERQRRELLAGDDAPERDLRLVLEQLVAERQVHQPALLADLGERAVGRREVVVGAGEVGPAPAGEALEVGEDAGAEVVGPLRLAVARIAHGVRAQRADVADRQPDAASHEVVARAAPASGDARDLVPVAAREERAGVAEEAPALSGCARRRVQPRRRGVGPGGVPARGVVHGARDPGVDRRGRAVRHHEGDDERQEKERRSPHDGVAIDSRSSDLSTGLR